ncbi:MAG: Biotin carboxylase [Chlamydiae bacterium]|nr:Biotin carboxylase [Chlamydiota bacterium]
MKKVLIANRGEIALRIIRACQELGLQTVAVYSEADHEALHVLQADEAICIGKAPSIESYLKIPHIISAAEITGADAIHPGYGFLSENANFASICESCGITFIGPDSKTIELLGNKAKAKETAQAANCPVIPGSDGVVENLEKGLEVAKKIGFPLLIKAVAGGGGKGIRFVYKEEDFEKFFIQAQTEAKMNFNNDQLYLEKMIVNPRHVEVQVMGDQHDHYIYLGERDCTIQRRRQKLIEETPSAVCSPELRKELGEAAARLARVAKYSSAGTVEFLLDEDLKFYFMEMNTRIQVEHTVTEELTGVDLLKEQIKVAMGHPLSLTQDQVEYRGHVIQFRINAEDPANNFAPCPGKLEYYMPPGGPHVRVDSACYAGYRIPPNYDSMIAKLIVKGKDRDDAIQIGKRALKEFHIGGIKTTIPFHLFMLEDSNFQDSEYNLEYIDKRIEEGCTFEVDHKDLVPSS